MGNTRFGSANNSLRNSNLQLQPQHQNKTQNPAAFDGLDRSHPFCSTSLHQTFTLASLKNVASREAVKFNDYANRSGGERLSNSRPVVPPLRLSRLILIMSLPERANQSNTVDTVILKVGKLPTD